MKAVKKKELVLNLIRDSLINIKLVSGLNSLGLDADNFNLYLGDTIFSLIGFDKSQYSDMVYEKIYLAMSEQVKDIDFTLAHEKLEALDTLSLKIYDELVSIQNDMMNSKSLG